MNLEQAVAGALGAAGAPGESEGASAPSPSTDLVKTAAQKLGGLPDAIASHQAAQDQRHEQLMAALTKPRKHTTVIHTTPDGKRTTGATTTIE